MALTKQGQQKARVSGHMDWPEMPRLFDRPQDAGKQGQLEAWYESLKQALLTKLDEHANEIETLKE